MVLWIYRALYELNLECDILCTQEEDWSGYDLVLIPELYSATEAVIDRVRTFVEQGGTVLASFRSFFSDEHAKIYHDAQPHGLTNCFGMTYNQFTRPGNATVDGAPIAHWIELLNPTTATGTGKTRHTLYQAL